MFGNTNDIRSKTEDNHTSEACYGGFGKRFSYEECREGSGGGRLLRTLPKLAMGAVACLFFGLLGTLCGILMFHIVNDNMALYYPNSAMLASDTDDTAAPIKEENVSLTASNISVIGNSVAAENVTAEESHLYRVPIGVMVHSVTENSAPHIAGMQAGDIIVALNDSTVCDVDSLNAMLTDSAGSNVTVTLFRDNAYVKISVSVE